MKVSVYNDQNDVTFDTQILPLLVQDVLQQEAKIFDEAAIYFVDEPTICKLHKQFFDDPSATDCISFPLDEENDPGWKHLGEVFVCPKAALDYTQKSGGDTAEEITLYVVHGLLHLLGYDDLCPEKLALMRLAEKKHLALIKAKGHLLALRP